VATYVVETYLSRARARELRTVTARLRRLISAATTAGRPIRHVRSFFVVEDETCFHVLEAPSMEIAADLSRLAGFVPDRIVQADSAGARARTPRSHRD
jgi:hypothetical protein